MTKQRPKPIPKSKAEFADMLIREYGHSEKLAKDCAAIVAGHGAFDPALHADDSMDADTSSCLSLTENDFAGFSETGNNEAQTAASELEAALNCAVILLCHVRRHLGHVVTPSKLLAERLGQASVPVTWA